MMKIKFVISVIVCALGMSLLHGEDLTTLDGKTFSNVTDISKYPKQIYFTFGNGRTNVAITNLSDDFRAKHGIVIKTNAPPVATVQPQPQAQPQLSPLDLFLFQHRDSDLYQSEVDGYKTKGLLRIEKDTVCSITLQSA